MKNKTIAILGIVSGILSVVTSATNSQGESTMSVAFIVISGTASILFTILATIRLWKISKFISFLFASTSIIFFGLEVIQVALSPADGTPFILILNITKVVSLLTYFYVIVLLWRIDKYQTSTENSNKTK